MLRPSLTTAAIALLCTGAMAQSDMKSKLLPVTAPIKRAGVFHVATGTWTRGATLANVTGPNTIYNNSCSITYFTGMLAGEEFQHRGRIPSKSGPAGDSVFYGTTNAAHRWDKNPGCQDEYQVNGFEFIYCTSHVGNLEMTHRFASSYIPVGSPNCGTNAPVFQYSFVITPLPGSATGAQACYVVGIDLSGGSEIALSGDGDGTYTGTKTAEQFGWGFGVTAPPVTPADFTGPIIAGNFSWTGGPGTVAGVLAPCTGTDGTVWDDPQSDTDPAEWLLNGTGMNSNDFFRDVGTSIGAPSGPGCYFFGGKPHADFYLKIYAVSGCPPPDPTTAFCVPNVLGIKSCPCFNNQQVPALSTKGCDHLIGVTPTGNGGALLFGSGDPSNHSVTCDVGFHVTGAHNPASNTNPTHILWRGTSTNATGVKSGFGIRCVTGTLKRIYNKPGFGSGGAGSSNNAVDFGLPSGDTDAWTASLTPAPATTLYYYDAFRDQQGSSTCFSATDRFNVSNAVSLVW